MVCIARSWTRRRILHGLSLGGFVLASACGPRSKLVAPGTSAGPDQGTKTPDEPDFSGLQGFCDAVPGIGSDEYADRRRRVRERMAEAGIDALLLEAGPSLFYFTGIRWRQSERPLLYLLPLADEASWIGPAFEAGSLQEQVSGAGAIHLWEEHEGPNRALAARVGAFKRIAIDPVMRLFVVDGLRRAAPSVDVAIDPGVIRHTRMIKSPAEIALLQRANEATKAALREVATRVVPGMRESAIAAMVRGAQAAAGLSEIWVLALAGSNAAFPHGTQHERELMPGEGILVDTGGSLQGYRSDISRTWFVGRPPPELAKAWATVREAQSKSFEAMRPGVSCASIDAIARAVIDGAGHGPAYRRFTHRLGHGIGLQVHEDPYLVGGEETLLRPGMVMSNEPGLYVAGEWGIRIEDIVVITDKGAEIFGPRIASLEDPFALSS